MEAGTYFLRVSTTSTTPLSFSLEVAPPKDSQVIEALNVRDQDLLNGGGDNGDRIIQATRGPKTTIDPVLSSFTNVSLRDAIYRAVNKRAGSTLFASDLASIAYLSVQGTPTSQLTNLNGFENLVNLIALDLPGHNLDANAIGKLQSLSKLQTLNLAGSDVQIAEIAEIPKLPKSLRKVKVERVMDGSQVASPMRTGSAFAALPLLDALNIGTSNNLVVNETAAVNGPSVTVNATTNTFQIVRNVPPVITMPSVINAFSEGQTVSYTSLLATPGISIQDRDPIVADSAIITDPAGVTTSIRANASSPVFKVGAGSNAQFTLSLTDRLKPNTLTTELLIQPSSTASLPSRLAQRSSCSITQR